MSLLELALDFCLTTRFLMPGICAKIQKMDESDDTDNEEVIFGTEYRASRARLAACMKAAMKAFQKTIGGSPMCRGSFCSARSLAGLGVHQGVASLSHRPQLAMEHDVHLAITKDLAAKRASNGYVAIGREIVIRAHGRVMGVPTELSAVLRAGFTPDASVEVPVSGPVLSRIVSGSAPTGLSVS